MKIPEKLILTQDLLFRVLLTVSSALQILLQEKQLHLHFSVSKTLACPHDCGEKAVASRDSVDLGWTAQGSQHATRAHPGGIHPRRAHTQVAYIHVQYGWRYRFVSCFLQTTGVAVHEKEDVTYGVTRSP